ncbi:Striatin family protein [Ancylostoma caninum]|uniref:Striatin family protein n=1 Tax=Ancylostoma caninum TaxID=29170 RepID=A0A368GZU1_ANCCA|nr:Striatin family protein [Ancylostoma caninum]
MHGVLHFLQHEWSKYEMEKAKWEMERAEMQARISFLQGERKGQENLKADLIRRIKMLEYCLKQERAKNYRLTHNGEDPPEYEEVENETTNEAVVPNEVDAYVAEGGSALGWKQGRQLLKQYLQGDWPSNERVPGKGPTGQKKDLDSDSESDERNAPRGGLDSEAADVLEKFDDFLHEQSSGGSIGRDEWAATDQGVIDRLKEKYKSEKRTKRSSGSTDEADEKRHSLSGFQTITFSLIIWLFLCAAHLHFVVLAKYNYFLDDTIISSGAGMGNNPMAGVRGKRGEFMDINDALGLPPDENIDIKDDFIIEFHPVEPVLITAGEDGTAKLWNLDGGKEKSGGCCTNYDFPFEQNFVNELVFAAGTSEIEPVYTFRGHLGPVLCMDLSPTGDHLFTDPKVLSERLRGHKDAIWSIAYHSSDNRLVSASSDGTIKLWEPGNFGEPLLRTLEPPASGLIPTSVDFVSTEPSQLLAAYTASTANIIDIETGATILTFDFGDDVAPGCRITRILSHPTMPLTITAGDDRKIRYFDNHTGKLTHSAVAHVEGISSLAIDPNGLYLLSGSHDGSLRMWNMEKRVCLQEISAHRKKYDASVTCVAFHPSRPLIGSAGADSLAKVYCPASS